MHVFIYVQHKITDKVLLAKSSTVLVVVILGFFLLHTIPDIHIDLGKLCDIVISVGKVTL